MHLTEHQIYQKVANQEISVAEAANLLANLNSQVQQTQQIITATPLPESITYPTIDVTQLNHEVEKLLAQWIGDILDLSAGEIDREENFMDLGIDSTQLIQLTQKFEQTFNIELYPTLLFEYQNLKELTTYLSAEYEDTFTAHFKLHTPPPPSPIPHIAKSTPVITQTQTQTVPSPPVQSTTATQQADIAIIGMAGLYADSPDLKAFWQHLSSQADLMSEIPASHFDYKPWFDPNAQPSEDKTYCKWGSFIDPVAQFDAGFFNISPREAEVMDPQLRLLLQVLYTATEDAGYGSRLKGSKTGMYVGVCGHSYADEMTRHGKPIAPHDGTGNAATMVANRPSFYFNLTGPSLAIDTACSSSLVALHLACQALRNNECDMAFAAGTNLLLCSWHYRYYSNLRALSHSGRCHTFDKRADGYVPGEGVGAILLKPLAKAIADNDRIHAVIKGSAVNHGGYTPSITAPSVNQEAQVLIDAWNNAQIDPATLGYIEAHGTGTELGDPVEINALKKAFKHYTEQQQFCAIGSAKAHVGHLEAAAGITGIIKVVLSMQHQQIPAMPQFEELNPYIQLAGSPLYINRQTQAWQPLPNTPRRAGVSSFGFGGAYAHVVLEEYATTTTTQATAAIHLIPLSAKNSDRLSAQAQNLRRYLQNHHDVNLADLAYTLQVGREAMPERLVFIVADFDELLEKLDQFIQGQTTISQCYQGRTQNQHSASELLVAGRAGQAFMEILLEDRELVKLAQLWVSGIDIAWQLLHDQPQPQLISLPSYPFETKHYWFTQAAEYSEYAERVAQQRSILPTPPTPISTNANPNTPTTDFLTQTQQLFAGLLKIPASDIKTEQSLLEMGADSVILLQAVQRIETTFGVTINVRQLFEHLNTVKALADYLSQQTPTVSAAVPATALQVAPPPPAEVTPTPSVSMPSTSSTASAWSMGNEPPVAETLTAQQQQHLNDFIQVYIQRTQGSKQQEQRYREVFADMRTAVGFRLETKEMCYPLVAHRSQGSKLWDVDGHEYVDLTMGFGVALFGHQPAFVTEALNAQLQDGFQVGPQTETAGEVAQLISELTGMPRVTFCNSGTEAVMTAIRIARAATGRKKIVIFSGSYHGHFDGTMAIAALDGQGSMPMAVGVLPEMVQDVLVLKYGSDEALSTIQAHAHDLAAVLVEPVQSRKPDLQPQAFLQRLREITQAAGTVLIFDEMITGFRIHPGGAQAWFGVQADMATYGKILGGGMPIGVVTGRNEYMARIDGGVWHYGDDSYPTVQRTFYAGTFCKHPLTMAATLAVLKQFKQVGAALQQQLNERTQALAARLNQFFSSRAVPIQVVYFGSLFRFALTGNFSYVYQPLEMDLFFYHLISRGVYVWELRTCFLSTAHSDADIARLEQAVHDSIDALQAGGFFAATSASPTPVAANTTELALSVSQQEMWVLLHAQQAATQAYNEVVVLGLQGQLDVSRLQSAFKQVVARHPTLRIIAIDGDKQTVATQLDAEMVYQDFSQTASDFQPWLSAAIQRPFDFNAASPLWRAYVVQKAAQDYAFVLVAHHLIADGWSLGVVLYELAALYSSAATATADLPEAVSYQRFIDWEAQLSAQTLDYGALASQAVPVLELTAEPPRPAHPNFRGQRHSVTVAAPLCQALKTLSHQHNVTLFTTLLTCFNVLLAKLSGESRFVVGIPVAGHALMGANDMVGQCTAMLPLTVSMPAAASLSTCLATTHDTLLNTQAQQQALFSKAYVSPVPITVIFNLDRPAALSFNGVQVQLLDVPLEFVKFDLFLNALEHDGQLLLGFDYRSDLFAAATVQTWAQAFVQLLQQLVDKPELALNALLPELTTLPPASTRVNGYRVDVEHITTVLQQHSAVQQAAVTVYADMPEQYSATLIAYVVLDAHCPIRNLRQFLQQQLPDYQVPKYFCRVTALPHTDAGDIDYAVLKVLNVAKETGTEYIAPRNPTETQFAAIWQSVLGLEQISVKDNFFELGGNSLKAVQLLNRLAQTTGSAFSLRDFFAAPTIAKLAQLAQGQQSRYQAIESTATQADYPLSHAQKRLWMLDQMEEGLVAYNVPGALKYAGAIDVALFRQALLLMMARHESLRTVFIEDDSGMPRQKILPRVELDLARKDLSQVADAEAQACALSEQDAALPFDLATGPLLRVKIYTLPADETFIAFNVHHIICDVWSLSLFARELFTLYAQLRAGQATALAPLPIQYKDYSAWQNALLDSDDMAQHRHYWQQKLAAPLLPLVLPSDHPRPALKSYDGASARFHLDAQLTSGLRTIGLHNQTSLFMVLLAVIKVLLHKYSQQEDIVIGTVTAGRDHPDLTDQIGFYVNSLVLRDTVNPEAHFDHVLKQVRQTLLEAYEHQIYPFDRLVEELISERDLSRNPFFDVMVVMDDRADIRQLSADFAVTEVPINLQSSQFDLTWYITEQPDGMDFYLVYAAALFEPATIAQLWQHFTSLIRQLVATPTSTIAALDGTLAQQPLPALHALDTLPTPLQPSYHQARLWFVDEFEAGQLYPASPVYYNMPLLLKLTGQLNFAALQSSFQHLFERHSVLRTYLTQDAEQQPLQVIQTSVQVNISVGDACDDEATAYQQAIAEIARPFAVSTTAPLLRAALIPFAAEVHLLVITAHHLVADVWSLNQLGQELATLYNAALKQQTAHLPTVTLQYADFALWQRQLPDAALATQLRYWQQQLAHLSALELPTDRPRPAIHTYTTGTVQLDLPVDVSERLQDFAQQQQVDVSTVLLTVYHVLLHRYAQQADIVTGVPTTRATAETESIVGPVANLVVLRSDCHEQADFLDVLQQLQRATQAAAANQDIPFDQLVIALHPKNDMSRTALFDVMFQWQDFLVAPQLDGIEAQHLHTNMGWGKYDLNLCWYPSTAGLTGVLTYNRDIYDQISVERLLAHYRVLLEDALNEPTKPLKRLALLTETERQQLLDEWNQGARVAYPQDTTLQDYFETQAAQHPDRTALVFEGQTLSYAALNTKANQLAHYLREQGVVADMPVGVCIERSFEMVTALLAILKAGGAYVPMDPDYPAERLQFMCQDAGFSLVLTQASLFDLFAEQNLQRIDVSDANLTAQHATTNPVSRTEPHHMAYVIYTSGSTGTPKGVMIEHRNVVRLFFNDAALFDFNEQDVWTLFHSYCFDFSVWEMYGALLFGGKLVIVPKAVAQEAATYHALLAEQQVTILNQTPSAFYALIQADLAVAEPKLSVKSVIFGGEALKPALLKPWYQRYPATQLINMYGITETTVHVTYKAITEYEITHNISNIGRPIPTLSSYILDSEGQLVPVGIAGELCVGGAGVGRGYLNREQLTAERFVVNLYNSGERLYKSGDLVKRQANGELVYLDRIDHQVKIRGFRIELGEIENNLLSYPDVQEAIVMAINTEAQPFLRAYLVSQTALAVEALRVFLGQTLPDYMVPSEFVRIDTMPLTSNGKVDRKRLLNLDGQLLQLNADNYVAPRNATETALAELWQAVLQRPQIGIYDNFFDLGGHSLKATQVVSRIHKQFGKKIPFKTFFSTPTIFDLAQLLHTAETSDLPPIEPVTEQDHYPLSYAQQRIWVAEQMSEQSSAYNMVGAFLLTGELDVAALGQAFTSIVQRHESLRTTFTNIAGEPRQRIHAHSDFAVEVHDLSNEAEPEQAARTQVRGELAHAFDLTTGPLLRVKLLKINPSSDNQARHVLLVNMHHIISDGVSVMVMAQEFISGYEHYRQHLDYKPTPLRIQYKDYTAWQKQWLHSTEGQEQQQYWLQQFADSVPVLQLPTDLPRPAVRTQNGAKQIVLADTAVLTGLNQLAQQHNASLFMVLLTTLYTLFYRYTGQEDMVLGVPIVGRNHPDLEQQIGFYINDLPLRLRFNAQDSFTTLLDAVKQITTEAYNHQDYPLGQLVEQLDLHRDRSRNPLFDVLVNMPQQDIPLQLGHLDMTNFMEESVTSKFDLLFVFNAIDQALQIQIEYNTDIFKPDTIANLGDELLRLFVAVLDQPEQTVSELKGLFVSETAASEQDAFLAAMLDLDEDF